jgi:hypothetical protein
MDNKTLENMEGQNERHASFWLASQELMANDFQKEIHKMKREIIGLKIENHTLKIKCGELREELCSRCSTTEDCESFKNSVISWGDIASFLTLKQMEFYQELLGFAIQNWIKPDEPGPHILVPPIQAFQKRIFELLEGPRSKKLENSTIITLADFVVSIICLREYDINHEDVQTIEEIFMGILVHVSTKGSPPHNGAESLLKIFMERDASRCIITRTICKLCSDLSQDLCEEIIGTGESTMKSDRIGPTDLDFLKLCSLCQICISQLSKWPHSNHAQVKLLKDVTDHIWTISKHCDVLCALSPAMAFEGKRLYCRLIASLQDMDT